MQVSNNVSLENLPEELLLYLFMFLDDIDLQVMAKVSPLMKRLSSDIIFWKNFRLIKNSAIITSRLFRDSRPDRVHLVQRNVLRGVHPRQIMSGQYINSPSMQILHENQNKVSWLLREQTIRRRLIDRPQVVDLEKRNVIPSGVQITPNVSPVIAARAFSLKKALKQAVLHRKLASRQEANELLLKGAPRVAPSLVAKKIELEKQFNEHELRKKFDKRPTVDEVETKIPDPRHIALIICPGVKPKIKSYEQLSQQ